MTKLGRKELFSQIDQLLQEDDWISSDTWAVEGELLDGEASCVYPQKLKGSFRVPEENDDIGISRIENVPEHNISQGSENVDSHFSMQVFVEKVEMIDAERQEDLCFAFRLLDFPVIMINPSEVGKGTNRKSVAFKSGKSCLFQVNSIEDLQERLSVVPLYIMLLRKSTKGQALLLASTSLNISDLLIPVLPNPVSKWGWSNGSFSLYDLMGNLTATAWLKVRLCCFGDGLLPHLNTDNILKMDSKQETDGNDSVTSGPLIPRDWNLHEASRHQSIPVKVALEKQIDLSAFDNDQLHATKIHDKAGIEPKTQQQYEKCCFSHRNRSSTCEGTDHQSYENQQIRGNLMKPMNNLESFKTKFLPAPNSGVGHILPPALYFKKKPLNAHDDEKTDACLPLIPYHLSKGRHEHEDPMLGDAVPISIKTNQSNNETEQEDRLSVNSFATTRTEFTENMKERGSNLIATPKYQYRQQGEIYSILSSDHRDQGQRHSSNLRKEKPKRPLIIRKTRTQKLRELANKQPSKKPDSVGSVKKRTKNKKVDIENVISDIQDQGLVESLPSVEVKQRIRAAQLTLMFQGDLDPNPAYSPRYPSQQ